jgi:hypothetical protein
MKFLVLIPITGVIAMLVLLACCKPKVPLRYGKEFNSERRRHGLPVIPEDWKLDGNVGAMHGRADVWLNPKNELPGDLPVPMHFSKGILYTQDEILEESDLYYGPRRFSHFTGVEVRSYRESIMITYCFRRIPEHDIAVCTRPGWHVSYLDGKTQDNSRPITLVEAERILLTWGIERLP